MGLTSLEKFPGSIPRCDWRVVIDGEVLSDWVGVNLRWFSGAHDAPRIEVQVVMPLGASADSRAFIKLMAPKEGGRKIELLPVCHEGDGADSLPSYTVKDVLPVKYELLQAVIQGTEVEGLDRRSNWAVLQSITFWASQGQWTGEKQEGE